MAILMALSPAHHPPEVFKPRKGHKLQPLPPRLAEAVGENRVINVDDLIIDHSYQRPGSKFDQQEIAADFDPKRLFRLAVNKRPDGTLAVMDGQQRVGAIRMLGGNYLVDCVVYHFATVEEEAEFYRHLNFGRRNPNRMDDWKARLREGDRDVRRIQDELDHAGLKLAKAGNQRRGIKSVGTIMDWMEKDIEAVSVVIMILGKLEYVTPIGAEVIAGLLTVEAHMKAHSSSLVRARNDKATWGNYLVAFGYSRIKEAANCYQSERKGLGGGGSSVAGKAAKGIIELLNHSLKTRRIPPVEG